MGKPPGSGKLMEESAPTTTKAGDAGEASLSPMALQGPDTRVTVQVLPVKPVAASKAPGPSAVLAMRGAPVAGSSTVPGSSPEQTALVKELIAAATEVVSSNQVSVYFPEYFRCSGCFVSSHFISLVIAEVGAPGEILGSHSE